jgi:hypothetical protein
VALLADSADGRDTVGHQAPLEREPLGRPQRGGDRRGHGICRAREQVRSDLMRCRYRVSKLLLLHGRVYPCPSAWTAPRGWLEQQRFDEPATELAYLCNSGVSGPLSLAATQPP